MRPDVELSSPAGAIPHGAPAEAGPNHLPGTAGEESSAAGPMRRGTTLSPPAGEENASGQVVDPAAEPSFKCRCGRPTHQPREHPVPCMFCTRPTWDFHQVCSRCRDQEAAA